MKRMLAATVVTGLLMAGPSALCEDWPQWRGPNRDGKSTETGLLKSWPAGGPKLIWAYEELGHGFSTVAVAAGTIYTTGMEDGNGYLYALTLDGQRKWRRGYGRDWTGDRPGARGTPTVDDGKVYVMSGHGRLVCFDAQSGEEAWSVETLKKFRGRNVRWGIAESVLIDGRNVICTPGGPDASVVALDKKTGETVWTSRGHSDLSSYCSPLLIRDKSLNLIVTCTAKHVVGVSAKTGRMLWRDPLHNRYNIHPNTPVYWKSHVYVTTGYDGRDMMLKLSSDGRKVSRAWTNSGLNVHHGGVVRVDQQRPQRASRRRGPRGRLHLRRQLRRQVDVRKLPHRQTCLQAPGERKKTVSDRGRQHALLLWRAERRRLAA